MFVCVVSSLSALFWEESGMMSVCRSQIVAWRRKLIWAVAGDVERGKFRGLEFVSDPRRK